MAITPLVVIDDDGTLTTGTVWNAALQTQLEANINAADCLDKSTTEQTVASTTSPTAVYSFSVPGGTLGTARILRLTLTGVYVNTHGSPSAFTVAITYGATTLVSGSIGSFATNTVGPLKIELILNANNATNSQRSEVQIDLPTSATNAAATVWAITPRFGAYNNTVAEDSTAAKTLTVTVTHGVSNAAVSFKRFAAMLEVLGA